jgi:hypothetical protein
VMHYINSPCGADWATGVYYSRTMLYTTDILTHCKYILIHSRPFKTLQSLVLQAQLDEPRQYSRRLLGPFMLPPASRLG